MYPVCIVLSYERVESDTESDGRWLNGHSDRNVLGSWTDGGRQTDDAVWARAAWKNGR